VDAASEDITALLVVVTLCLEAVGPLSLAAVVASSLLLASTGLLPEGLPLSWSLSDAAPWAPLVCAAVASEAAFYLACIAAAHLSSSTLGHAPGAARPGVRAWPEERRAALWRRILTDSSTTPHDFVAEWMYREGSGATSPAALLAEWAARRVGLSKARKGRAAELSAGGVAYSDLCVGDVYDWLAATFFGASRADLTPAQDREMREMVDKLEAASGALRRMPGDVDGAPSRAFATSPGIRRYCAAADAVRWRHRPLSYYAVSHGVGAAAYTPCVMRRASFERRKEEELTYWYRPVPAGTPPTEALVFVHGIGIGPAPYASFLGACADEGTPIVAVEMGAFSQRLFPCAPPSPDRFAALLHAALGRLGIERAVLVGHSLGSTFVHYATSRDGAGRVAGVALLDPVACLLHHSTTTGEFVYSSNQASLEEALMDFVFKKELWSSIVVSRNLPWHEASLWPADCSPQTPTLVAVGARDLVVAPTRVRAAFGSWQARLRGVRVLWMEQGAHGSWLADEAQGAELVAAVRSLRREASRGGRRLRLPRLRANERADGGERAAAVAGKPGTQQKLGDLGI